MITSIPESARGVAANARKGGVGDSRAPLSARSAASSVVSTNVNSQSYLNNREYNFLYAKSVWLQRVQGERTGCEGEEAVLKRLPGDFEPFYAIDIRKRVDVHEGDTPTQDGDAEFGGEKERRIDRWCFHILFTVFSNRCWDRLYLVVGLLWSVLCPGYLDSRVAVGRAQLATLMSIMFALAATPATFAVLMKSLFNAKLRRRLQDNRHTAGVFFILAIKSIPVPAACTRRRRSGRQVHAAKSDENNCRGSGFLEEDTEKRGDSNQRAPLGGSSRPSTPLGDETIVAQEKDLSDRRQGMGDAGDSRYFAGKGQAEIQGSGVENEYRSGRNANMMDSKFTSELELPPRHWMCIVCKKVNVLPDEWNGKPAKTIQAVIKRKTLDTKAMYGMFKTKPGLPLCEKCHTPFNYSWRNGDPNKSAHQQAHTSEKKMSRSGSAANRRSTDVPFAPTATEFPSVPTRMPGPVRNLMARVRKTERVEGGEIDAGPELWYGREFRRQLKTYFKPELERPTLSLRGGRYPVGSRVACFVGKGVWYPGTVATARDNSTYDVRYDNGDIAQHVFPNTIRFQTTHRDSDLLLCYYGLALVASIVWPFTGFLYFSTATADISGTEGAVVAMPAFALGVAGVLAVGVQFWAIYGENRSAGILIATRYAAIVALPSVSLALVGGMATAKALNPSSSGLWVEILFLPGVIFSIAGGGYAHALSPAYGKAWGAASLPWLIFLLLASLRLDSEAGGVSPTFGRMRWMGVCFPLWVFVVMLIALHHVLPYVWDIEVLPDHRSGTGDGTDWLSQLTARLGVAASAFVGKMKRKGGDAVAKDDNDDQKKEIGQEMGGGDPSPE